MGHPVLADQVAHFFVLGLEVALEGGLAWNSSGDAFCDRDAAGLEGGDLVGVVGHQADGLDPEVLEDLGGELELAMVGAVAELEVGFNRVEPLVLKLVGAELGHEADAATFLLLVEQDAGALVGDAGESEVELVVAIAAQGVEDVSGEALRVDADDGRSGLNVAEDESDGGLDVLLRRGVVGCGGERVVENALEAENAEVGPARGKVGVGHFANTVEGHHSIIDSRRVTWDSLLVPGGRVGDRMCGATPSA